MPIRLMTTREILDLAAIPTHRGEYESIEAMVSMADGCARSTHSFRFYRESPVKKRRWFDHFMSICDVWAIESEKRIMETYGDVIWGVWDDQPIFADGRLPKPPIEPTAS